jgi:hypothetical protein
MKIDWSENDFVTHWKYYKPPARASPSDLEFIKNKILEKGKEVKVLILGATPEYRELCGNLDIPVALLDFSRNNYEYLSDEVFNAPKEMFIEGNWLHSKLSDKFDIILGDNVINVLPKKDIPLFFKNVANMLKKDGFFMPRSYIRTPEETNFKVEEGIKEYRKKKHIYGLYTGMSRAFYIGAYNFKDDVSFLKDWFKAAEKMYKKGLINKKELDFFLDKVGWKDREFQFFIPLDKELTGTISEHFDILEVFYGTEPYLENKLPLHVLKVKR